MKQKVLGYLLYLRVKNFPGAFLEFVQIHGTATEQTEWAQCGGDLNNVEPISESQKS